MKMNTIFAPAAGTVKEIRSSPGMPWRKVRSHQDLVNPP